MKTVLLVVAGVLVVFGGVFFFQGIGALGGSGMTGDRTWAVIGPVMVVVGLVVAVFALRRRRTRR